MDDARRRRLASLAIVAVLHAAIVTALLTLSHQKVDTAHLTAAEAILWLPPPPKRDIEPRATTKPGATVAERSVVPPDDRGITLPVAPPAPSLDGLHGSLFGCADLDRLTPEERTHCGSALMAPDDSVDFRDGTGRSRQAALWERGRVRQNGPLLLPCMNPHAPPGISLAMLACLAKGAAEGGFDPDKQPSYADTLKIEHLPNNGDPPEHPSGF